MNKSSNQSINTDKGFVPLCRNFFDTPFWLEERQFSRAEAWLDLLAAAKYKDVSVACKGVVVSLAKGQLVASNRYLQQRWGWSSSKIVLFLKTLIKGGLIQTKTEHNITVITICENGFYDDNQNTKNTHGTHSKHTHETNIKNEKDSNKEIKEEYTFIDGEQVAAGETITLEEFKIQHVFNYYNQKCTNYMPRAQTLTPARAKAIKKNISSPGGLRRMLLVIDKAADSPFLCGINNNHWRANLDWILNPNNFNKIIEGTYDTSEINIPNHKPGINPKSGSKFDPDTLAKAIASGVSRATTKQNWQ